MKVIKIYNNNIVAVVNSENKVALITGRGVGYHHQLNDSIIMQDDWHVFELLNPKLDEYHKVLERVNLDAFEISQLVYQSSQKQLDYEVNKLFVIVLADHITFKLELYKNNVFVPNLLTSEIRTFYPKEFRLGQEAVQLINAKFATAFDDEEASTIAMHILNMMMGAQANSVFVITEFIKTMMQIIRNNFDLPEGEDAWVYERLIIHIKYLGQRLNNPDAPNEVSIFEGILSITNEESQKLDELLIQTDRVTQKLFNRKLSTNERIYLSIHILRIIRKEGEKL